MSKELVKVNKRMRTGPAVGEVPRSLPPQKTSLISSNESEIDSDVEMDHDDIEYDVSEDEGATDQPIELPDAMRDISFGAIAEAQESLNANPIRQPRRTASNDARAEIKARLAELKGLKSFTKSTKHDIRPRIEDEAANRRTSKHAPTSQSSTHAVGRFRPAVTLSANPQHVRDPRFSSVSTNAVVNEDRLRQNYDFLAEYRDKEAVDMKAVLMNLKLKAKKRKSGQLTEEEVEEVERLKRQINSIENKKKSEEKKAKEREVVRRHRKEERELIKLGKKPFYLKRGEAKKQAEQERFDSMKGRDKKKLTERREKKKSQKEKRGGPGFGIG